jgi:hypothetical protein
MTDNNNNNSTSTTTTTTATTATEQKNSTTANKAKSVENSTPLSSENKVLDQDNNEQEHRINEKVTTPTPTTVIHSTKSQHSTKEEGEKKSRHCFNLASILHFDFIFLFVLHSKNELSRIF